MAHAMASMGGLIGSSQTVLDGSLQISGSRLSTVSTSRIALSRPAGLSVRAQQGSVDAETSRRAVIGLVAAGLAGTFAKAAFAEAKPIKIGGPPPPSGGLPGTLNSDEPRDFSLPLKNRFYIQPLTPAEAVQRVKDSAKEIVGVKDFIDKKAWPYVQNDLRLRAEYLRYDLKTVISAKPKDQKGKLQDLTGKLFKTISDLDHAAKTKNSTEAEMYYAATVSTLNDVLANLG
ncbi:Oxygen-evolving enhancer protein 3-1, chloroplastic [Capsicum chinense]|uniref:16 kDa subunit of oxygen evolving system of photosystem II n=1 Tax=Capsicum annuum TaxID=4072 RepID=A0A1U8FLF1_CAPAN|nr:oxygen-evolving enhancer protein 3-2, chloroplastic [Capsicum annuum]KAF3624630.1 Oxygen-evolving enhancer protein 3-2, chloroplastic [Capsicum annuum]KAF3625814.1 Oxygen-evolving enhancer protein 3-2, chloroplastic [Capsicum annuum]PHT90607.1 Oxygen-evolving enhancer protein 3-2, chloroplastic [Capsicum annuum]PHU26571.1 Oxygen-evolving enhancer protein 3-1, chloroplastic [Capsicum chinense]